jgi:cytoskeletal protein RodZ
MTKIVRAPTEAKGGITPEEAVKLKTHADLWIDRIMRTESIEPSRIVPAVERLYEVSGLKRPRVVVVPSPLVANLAGGLSAAIWHLRKHGKTRAATDTATDDATDDATYAATDDATDDATYAATDAATDDATYAATRAATYAATYAATDDATDTATYAATDAATDDATDAATRAATYAATYAATRAATDTATRAATDTATDDATDDATYAATDAATRAATYAATRAATYAATYAATDAATRAATYAATRAATYAASPKHWLRRLVEALTPNAIEFSLGVIRLSWRMRQGGNHWGQYDSYLSACRDVLGLAGLGCWEKYAAWEECAIEGSWRIMHEEFCIVSDFPEFIRVDIERRPHCETGPSHRWRDGWELYHLDGQRLEKEVWESITSKAMTFGEIMAIENADIRALALKYNPEAILNADSKLVDISKRGNALYLIQDTELNRFLEEPEIWFLKMFCPTGRTFVEGVDPAFARKNPKADTCQARALGLTPSQYRSLTVEG